MNVLLQERENPVADLPVWWVIHTRPRCEKKMAQWLESHGFDGYLPLRRVLRSYPGKEVEFELPVFQGYVFGCFSLRERNAVYGSGRVAQVLEVQDQKQLLQQLDTVRRILQTGLPVSECDYFKTGQRVRIHGGELKGIDGVVQRFSGKNRLVVSVDFLQRSVAVEVDSRWLSPAF